MAKATRDSALSVQKDGAITSLHRYL